ncbi:hypothetical protein [Neorhizobium sp. SOG26]|uniref:hypothetical protein n=1 Tax=Neorhizobium sp. SOG26 TaxID=2060726 RepID=UPI004040B8AD
MLAELPVQTPIILPTGTPFPRRTFPKQDLSHLSPVWQVDVHERPVEGVDALRFHPDRLPLDQALRPALCQQSELTLLLKIDVAADLRRVDAALVDDAHTKEAHVLAVALDRVAVYRDQRSAENYGCKHHFS